MGKGEARPPAAGRGQAVSLVGVGTRNWAQEPIRGESVLMDCG